MPSPIGSNLAYYLMVNFIFTDSDTVVNLGVWFVFFQDPGWIADHDHVVWEWVRHNWPRTHDHVIA